MDVIGTYSKDETVKDSGNKNVSFFFNETSDRNQKVFNPMLAR